MLIMLFIIGLLSLMFGTICYTKQTLTKERKFFYWVYNNEWFPSTLTTAGIVLTIFSLIFIISIGAIYSNSMVIDDKIALYEEENMRIEQNIAELVKEYQEYESLTFENIKLDNPTTIFYAYPELKSNTLANKQIELYISNNAKIKELKEDKLTYRVYKWWLFF